MIFQHSVINRAADHERRLLFTPSGGWFDAYDVPVTYADSTGLERDYGFTPKIGIREGLRRFAEWYKA